MFRRNPLLALLALGTVACASGQATEATPSPIAGPAPAPAPAQTEPQAAEGPLRQDPFPSTYRPFPSGATLIRNATVLTGTGVRIDGGSVLIQDGRIAEVGRMHASNAELAGFHWL